MVLFGIAEFLAIVAAIIVGVAIIGVLFFHHGRKQLSRGNIFGGLLSAIAGAALLGGVVWFLISP